MKNLRILFNLFTENRPIFHEVFNKENTPTLGAAESVDIAAEAAKDSEGFFEQFGKFKDKPEETITEDTTVNTEKDESKGLGHYTTIQSTLEKEIGSKIFPKNADLAKQSVLQLNQNYFDLTQKDPIVKDIEAGNVKNVKFEKPIKQGNDVVFKTTLLGAENKVLHTIEVKFTKESLDKLEAERENVKKAAEAELRKEQDSFMTEMGTEITLREIIDNSTNKVQFTKSSENSEYTEYKTKDLNGNELGITVKVSKKDTKKFTVIEEVKKDSKDKALVIETSTDELGKDQRIKILVATRLEQVTAETLKKKEAAEEAAKEPAKEPAKEKELTPYEKALETAGIIIENDKNTGKEKVYFTVEGVERSFLLTKEFKAKLEKQKDADQIKLMCYEKLIGIYKTVKTNKYNVAGGNEGMFTKSNETIRAYVKAKGKVEVKPEEDKNYEKIGKFNGIEMYVDIKGNIVAKDGSEVTDKTFTITDKTSIEDIKKSPEYTKAIEVLMNNQKALKEGRAYVGKSKDGMPIYVDGSGALYGPDNTAYKATDTGISAFTIDTATAVAKEREQDKLATESTEAKNRLEALIQRDLATLQQTANEVVKANRIKDLEENESITTQKITIDTSSVEKSLGGGGISREFAIYVDGKQTPYSLTTTYSTQDKTEIKGRKNDFTPEFAIQKPGDKTKFLDVKKNKSQFKDQFQKILDEHPNVQKISDLKKATERLQQAGIEIKDPAKLDSLTVQEYKTIINLDNEVTTFILDENNFFTIKDKCNKLNEQITELLKGSQLKKIDIEISDQIFTWDSSKKELITNDDEQKVSKIKKEQLSEEEYQTFIERNGKETLNERAKSQLETRKETYQKKYKELTDKPLKIDYQIAKMRKGDIEKNWHHYSATSGAVEFYMSQPPFEYTIDQVPRTVAEIVNNGIVSFNEIFDIIKSTLKTATLAKDGASGIPVEALKSGGAFMKEFERLLKKGDKLEPYEVERKDYMFNSVIVPCLDLKMAIARLRYDTEAEAKKEKAKEEKLSPEQQEIMEGLAQLCSWEGRKFSSKAAKDWEKFLFLFTKGEKKITMSNIDGTTFTLDTGTFQRHFDPKAAIAILVHRPGLYSKDAEGKSSLLKDKVLGELNKIIEKGLLQILILEKSKETNGNLDRRGMSKLIGSAEYKKRLGEVTIKDIKGPFTAAQFKAFQLGFIIDQEARFDTQIKEGIETFQESNPVRAEILKQLVEKGLSIDKVKAVQQQLINLSAGFVLDQSGNFVGAGGAVGINIGNGLTITVGLGGGKGKFAAGVALNVKIYEKGIFSASASVGISTAGLGANIAGKFEAGKKLDVSIFVGAGISWTGVPGGQIGFSLNWNAERDFKDRLNSAEGKIFSPKLLAALDELKITGNLSDDDINNLKRQLREQVKEETLRDFKSPVITGGGIQLVMVGAIPVPIASLSICIGSITISTPNRREIAKQLANLSGQRAEFNIRAALAQLEKGNAETRYVEGLDRIAYSSDGKLMILDNKQEVSFDGITSSLDDYNKVLDKVDVKLIAHPKVKGKDGIEQDRIELRVDKPEMKDIHINIDPLLKNLVVAQDSDNGKIFLVGNIDDLIITRERFSLPFQQTEDGATMRDYITIKQKSSVQGERDNRWIDANAPYKLVKLMEHAKFYKKAGVDTASAGSNILEVAGFSTKETKDLTAEDRTIIETYLAAQPAISDRLGQSGLDEKEGLVQDMKSAKTAKGERMLQSDYDKVEITDDFLEKTDSILGNKKFMSEVAKVVREGSSIIELLKRPENKKMLEEAGLKDDLDVFKKGNEKLLNVLVLEIEDDSFTTFYKGNKDAKLSTEQLREGNKKLLDSLNRRVKFIKDNVFMPEFERAHAKMGKELKNPADKLCERLFDQMFKDLREKLDPKKNPPFDFRTLSMESIPDGAEFLSGSKRMEKGQQVGTLATSLNYSNDFYSTELIHKYGFLDGTIKDYMQNAKTEEDKEIAKILIEIIDPLQDGDKEFLESEFTQRMLSLDALVLIVDNKDYKKLIEITKDSSKLKNPEYKETFGKFKTLITELRNAFTSGTSFEKKIPGTLATLKVNFKETKLVAGSYTKCANPSLYLDMKARVGIYKDDKLVAEMVETSEMVDASQSKQFFSISLLAGIAVTSTGGKKDKSPEEGVVEGDGGEATEVTGTSGTGDQQYTSGPGVGSAGID